MAIDEMNAKGGVLGKKLEPDNSRNSLLRVHMHMHVRVRWPPNPNY